jgi:zinc and cadmium transporter
MWPTFLIVVYCSLIAVAAIGGGVLPSLIRLTHTRMQLILSLVGGLVLGVGLLHLLPHSAAETNSLDHTVGAALVGLLVMFFLIRIFHVHQHAPVEDLPIDRGDACDDHDHDHDHDRHHDSAYDEALDHAYVPCEHPDHHHDYPTDGEHCVMHRSRYSWLGLAIGLALHTVIDGIALAASVTAATHATSNFGLLGAGTFLAILLHKPLDAMSIASVMAAGGWSQSAQRLVTCAFAGMCGLGAIGFHWGIAQMGDGHHQLIGLALGFAAGVFLCISLADILPELQFHSHDRLELSAALLSGIAIAWGIGFFEPEHSHDHGFPDAHNHGTHHQEAHDHISHDAVESSNHRP